MIAPGRFDRILRGTDRLKLPSSRASLTELQADIGRNVATLIPDGATLQLGLGAIAEAALVNLGAKRALGIHSGIVSPNLHRLVAEGVVTGGEKNIDRGKIVATGLYGAADENGGEILRALSLRPISETHDPRRLMAQSRLWAVNSALEVDLGGQANAEYINGLRVASGGGQADFVRAAHASEGGGSIIALPSCTGRGESRIVACLPQGHRPTSAAQDVDFVVTEWGCARLRGRSMSERAEAMIDIAHPRHREELRRARHEHENAVT